MHTSEFIATPKSTKEIILLSVLNEYPFNPLEKDKEYLGLNYCQKTIFELDFKKEKIIFLKERQKGCTVALLAHAVESLKQNKNYSILFLTESSMIELYKTYCLFLMGDKNNTKHIKNKIKINNSSIEFSSGKHINNNFFHGKTYDLVVWDEIRIKEFLLLKSNFNKNFIGTSTILDNNIKIIPDRYCNLHIFKDLWNINEPNLNVLPVYLQLLPDLTQESEFVGKSLIENYGRF